MNSNDAGEVASNMKALNVHEMEQAILDHQEKTPYHPQHKIRFVTASSLFDGHDAAINIVRRILQSSGVEVIHLGHNRSVEEIVTAAIQEDVQAVAISSYQGGHMEFFKYMYDLLHERGAGDIKIFGGGGGVIVADEIAELERYGISKIFSPDDGRRLGLQGMINWMIRECDQEKPAVFDNWPADALEANPVGTIARLITAAEGHVGCFATEQTADLSVSRSNLTLVSAEKSDASRSVSAPVLDASIPEALVLGITGTGGAGKSSLTDELIRRFLRDFPDRSVAILSVDPSKQKTGGALLGDRIRMNAIYHPRVFMRSLATRGSKNELSVAIQDAIKIVQRAGFNLVVVETSGIGQGSAGIIDVADVALYVMTSEFGAPTQLEKIDMLDYADIVAINKFDRRGSDDALRHVRKQVQRNRTAFDENVESMPVYGTIASQFNDPGTNTLYEALISMFEQKRGAVWHREALALKQTSRKPSIIPGERVHYLLEIVNTVHEYRKFVDEQSTFARKCYQLQGAMEEVKGLDSTANEGLQTQLSTIYDGYWSRLDADAKRLVEDWPQRVARYQADELVTKVRDKEIRTPLFQTSLSGSRIPKVCLPHYEDWGDVLKWSMLENVPGAFPFTAGVFALKRREEAPKRQFAGEGTPERTNKRFHYLSENDTAKRLSTAFDSVTLYGEDPDPRPDIYGKIGESGVSICTLEDMKKLYAGFDLCAPSTSVSMTINGPAPILLAMFMNTAIDQQIDKFTAQTGHVPGPSEAAEIRERTLKTVRGTVQADILKEDQGQNTCIFSTEFALRMMGDIQQYFINNGVRNYYSVSISGYHIAEAGANPITQVAFTLANAFTYVEYYLSRNMPIDSFAPNLSFFFSNGMDPEYTVIGRVARRIWATVMKRKYGANARSQKLKYHIQTSGRSLHAQEIDFNDIRTTLQALIAVYDNCNSLHTNAYDEAITTPTEESVRRAMAIQMIINREFGLAMNENSLQGSFVIEELTDLVEEAVMQEFLRLNDRGGVLGAMETQYQRSKIQEESMNYERLKHSGALPIIGVNTFINPETLMPGYVPPKLQLARSTKDEKEQQIDEVRRFQHEHEQESGKALERLQACAEHGENIFAELMETVRVASLGQITTALYSVGGQYRRNM